MSNSAQRIREDKESGDPKRVSRYCEDRRCMWRLKGAQDQYIDYCHNHPRLNKEAREALGIFPVFPSPEYDKAMGIDLHYPT